MGDITSAPPEILNAVYVNMPPVPFTRLNVCCLSGLSTMRHVYQNRTPNEGSVISRQGLVGSF